MRTENITLRMAWRNVWRNRHRTLLTLLTIMIGCAMIIFFNSMAKGGHDQMIEDAVGLNTGHIQIHEKGFWDNQTIDYAFKPSETLITYLSGLPQIEGFSPRILTGGLLSFRDTTRGVLIQGIDPRQESRVTHIHNKILPGGRFLSETDTTHAIIGSTLATHIHASVNDTFAIISQGFDGSIAADRFTVVGIFNSGNPDFDRELILIPLSQADMTFSMMGYVHSMVIRLTDISLLTDIKTDIVEHTLATRAGATKLEVLGWDAMMPELIQFIVMDDVGGYIFDFILFMVVAFGILNTVQMSVFERTREFGIMLSIGTRPRLITRMILTETALISLFGIALGLALGYGVSLYFQIHPIDYSQFSEEISLWGISTTLYPADTTLKNITVTALTTFALAMVFSIFPARRAAKLNPVEAIRKL
ncbi:MAG: ABC transporter permease [Desulfobacterales bacterium]|nr:ABC transporter permease [Desulfobacterales bacterium]MDD4393343.1 ABC transporter permease [Desulfobacterales bacterium]